MKKNIIVTGGAQGIGKNITRNLLAKDYCVTVFDVEEEAILEMQTELDRKNLRILKVDVSDEIQVKEAIEHSVSEFRGIYGLINNAVKYYSKPLSQLTLEEWNLALATNLTGAFLCTKYAEVELRKSKGAIINISSTRAIQSEPDTESYSASKGGLISLTHALAMSLSPDVRVNSISPGWIDVSALKKKSMANQIDLSIDDHLQHPAGRVGRAEDISNMILFLLNTENDFITAQNFIIDGGMTKKMIYV